MQGTKDFIFSKLSDQPRGVPKKVPGTWPENMDVVVSEGLPNVRTHTLIKTE